MAKKKNTPITWKLEDLSLKELLAYSRNPRRLTKSQAKHLKESLQTFGLIDKPVVNTDGTLIGGHQRVSLLEQEGVTHIQVWKPSRTLTDKEVAELNIRLNKAHGEWDHDILANEWEEDELLDWGFEAAEFGIDEEEQDKEQTPADEKPTCPECGQVLKKNP